MTLVISLTLILAGAIDVLLRDRSKAQAMGVAASDDFEALRT